jgi:spermidine synthase
MRLDEKLDAHSGAYFDGDLIESRQTPYQLVEVFATPSLGKLMRIDGANMVSERDEFFYHENLVHPPAVTHADPRDVLIIGGGDGGTLEEVLKHPGIVRVVLAELDAGVIALARAHFFSVHRGAFDDPRVDIRIGDGMAFIRDAGQKFDLIFLDLTDPLGPAEALYTQAFFTDCKRALHAGGALVLHIGSPYSHPDRIRQSLASLRKVFLRAVPWFVHVPMYGATWGFAAASDTLDPAAMSPAEVNARLATRHIGERQYYNGEMHMAMLSIPEYVKPLIS